METNSYIGNDLFETLKEPELSVPALLREDNCVEFHSSYQQFIYEYLFRQQEFLNGETPKVCFTHLTEQEESIQAKLFSCIKEAESLAHEINSNNESQIFFRLRWY